MSRVLVVDGANVVGSRPDGWWKDRAGAARRLHEQLMTADLDHDQVVLVLEGAAKAGHRAGRDGDVWTVHAPASGDDAVVDAVRAAVDQGSGTVGTVTVVTVVTADRELRRRAEHAGATVVGPAWLLELLDGP